MYKFESFANSERYKTTSTFAISNPSFESFADSERFAMYLQILR